MRWIDWINGLKLKSVADFLDFGSGAFRSRIQAGTLTADQTLTATKSGNIAVDTARSTSIQNLTAAGLVQLAAGADSAASIATAAQIRSAAGAGTIATQNADNLTFTGRISGYFAQNFPASTASVIGKLYDRLANAQNRYSAITYTNISLGNNLWDASYESYAVVAANVTATVQIDFLPIGSGHRYTYGGGSVWVTFFPGYEPVSCSVALNQEFGGNQAPITYPLAQFAPRLWEVDVGHSFIRSLMLTFVAGPNGCLPIAIEWSPNRPDGNESERYLDSYAPIVLTGPTGNRTTIGFGTIQIGGGATLTAMLRATKTIAGTNPETITVTGAAVGDIVELSRPILGEVTAANTVTFNGAGLTGNLVAIVKRYT